MTQAETPIRVRTKNTNLVAAKAAKFDEFYTQWADIEREMNAYLEYDPDLFRDKIVLLPCDDPEWSNFAKFFALHFTEYGLKKLISTSYAPDSNPALFSYQPTLFELNDPQFDETKTHANGKKFVLEAKDINDDGVVNIDDLQLPRCATRLTLLSPTRRSACFGRSFRGRSKLARRSRPSATTTRLLTSRSFR
jgi:hypothetical protein